MQTGPHLLDLACGDGRNALYLAQLGMQVEAVEFLPDGIAAVKPLAAAKICACIQSRWIYPTRTQWEQLAAMI